MVGSGVPAAAIFCENLADADDAALMRLVISLKNGSLPIRRAIIGLNSAVRQKASNYTEFYYLYIRISSKRKQSSILSMLFFQLN